MVGFQETAGDTIMDLKQSLTEEIMNKKSSYTLPNGQCVLLKILNRADYDSINQWIQKEYMKNVTEAVYGLDPISRQELLLAALDKAASLSFQFGNGKDILLGSAYGLTRLVYQLIDNPPFTFDAFNQLVFPQTFLTVDGLMTITQMLRTAYAHVSKAEFTEDDAMQLLKEQNWLSGDIFAPQSINNESSKKRNVKKTTKKATKHSPGKGK